MERFLSLALLLSLVLCGSTYGAESSLSEKEASLLTESQFADAVKKGNCIVMYYTSDERSAGGAGSMTPVQQGDQWMRAMIAFRDRLGAAIRFYRVNWKGFSQESIVRIKSDLATTAAYPASPTFAVYTKYDAKPARVRAAGRPDMYAWFIHDVMDDFMPISKRDKGEFLFTGWLVTDVQSEHINVVNERKEEIVFGGKPENVQIVSFVSLSRDGFGCTYEKIYTRDGRLLGSIEDYGPYGTFGYFDYDRTGKFQYRVTYPAREGK
jgi:hypothetical protein